MTTDTEQDPSAVGRYGPFAIAVMTMSLVSWPIAFNLGAFGVVFYLFAMYFHKTGSYHHHGDEDLD